MRLLGRKKPKIKGEIGFFGLTDWWLETFTEEEQAYIDRTYAPFGTGGVSHPLLSGEILASYETAALFLSILATWFKRTGSDRDIAKRILAKAISMASEKQDVLALHFAYQTLIEIWYRDRDTIPGALGEATRSCQKQIELAVPAAAAFKKDLPARPLPSHVGYKQLAIIYEKQGKYAEAIRVAQQAKKQGWAGDWDKRIERYQKKLEKKK